LGEIFEVGNYYFNLFIDQHPAWSNSKIIKILVAKIDRSKITDNDIKKISLIFDNLGKWERMISAGIDIIEELGFNIPKKKPIQKYEDYWILKDYVINPIDATYKGEEEIELQIELEKDKERTGRKNNRTKLNIEDDKMRLQSIINQLKSKIEFSFKWVNLQNVARDARRL